MKKLLSMLLCVSVFFSMVGCSAAEQKKMVGTWETQINILEVLGETLFGQKAEGTTTENIEADSLLQNVVGAVQDVATVTVITTFHEDGTYAITMDRDMLITVLRGATNVGIESVLKMADMALVGAGIPVSAEGILSLFGVDTDEFKEKNWGETIADAILDEIEMKGQYLCKGGMLYLTTDTEVSPIIGANPEEKTDTSQQKSWKYDLTKDTLTITEAVEAEEGSTIKIYPIIFNRITEENPK